MFNNQPSQGLGQQTSRLLAFGLGNGPCPGPGPCGPPTDDIQPPQRLSGGGGVYRPRKDHPIDPYLYDEELRRKRIALIKRQDAEIEEMIITLITKGFI